MKDAKEPKTELSHFTSNPRLRGKNYQRGGGGGNNNNTSNNNFPRNNNSNGNNNNNSNGNNNNNNIWRNNNSRGGRNEASSKDKSHIRCYTCKRWGHYASECDSHRCGNCGGHGHDESVCPSPQQKEEEESHYVDEEEYDSYAFMVREKTRSACEEETHLNAFYDSATNNHCSGQIQHLTNVREATPVTFRSVSGQSYTANRIGDLNVKTSLGVQLVIKNVRVATAMGELTLLSLSRMTQAGYTYLFEKDKMMVKKGGRLVDQSYAKRGIYPARYRVVALNNEKKNACDEKQQEEEKNERKNEEEDSMTKQQMSQYLISNSEQQQAIPESSETGTSDVQKEQDKSVEEHDNEDDDEGFTHKGNTDVCALMERQYPKLFATSQACEALIEATKLMAMKRRDEEERKKKEQEVPREYDAPQGTQLTASVESTLMSEDNDEKKREGVDEKFKVMGTKSAQWLSTKASDSEAADDHLEPGVERSSSPHSPLADEMTCEQVSAVDMQHDKRMAYDDETHRLGPSNLNYEDEGIDGDQQTMRYAYEPP